MADTRPQIKFELPDSRSLERFRRKLLPWFEEYGRKFPWRNGTASKYKKIVSELLLQRTRAETVALFFPRFIKDYPSWEALASARLSHLRSYLQPIGLWRRRAISMQALASEMIRARGRFPRKRGEIEQLPGVGQYIASSIMLFCYGDPEPLIDVNMARVLERVYGPRILADIRYDPYLQALARSVVDCGQPKELNWAILDFAALVCTIRNPRCDICPLSTMCSYRAEHG